MNRIDLQVLAQARLREAQALLNAGEWSGAYYLAGYAVECGLKACIARLTNLHDFPDKDRALRSYSHNIENLVIASELITLRDVNSTEDPILRQNWQTVREWTEQSRYKQWSELKARKLFLAISDPNHGVFPWIMDHW